MDLFDVDKDKDTCSSEDEEEMVDPDFEAQFPQTYCISSEEVITVKDVYTLCLTSNKQFNKVAAGMSNGSVELFDVQTGKHLNKCYPIKTTSKASTICGAKFLDENNLLIGKTNGKIFLYDVRSNKKVETFEVDENSEETTKPIICFDTNANERVICAGTEQVLNDSYIIFFDIRKKKMLGGYCDSHQDDVTSVKFHPKNSDKLISGSTDGLINIFDISQTTEEDAIQMTLNTDSSVNRLNWHKNVYEKDIISCITHTNDLQIFDIEEGNLISSFERTALTSAIKRKSERECNLINCHSLEDDSIFVLTGSNNKAGDSLRSLQVMNKQLIPLATFDEIGPHKQIVRDSVYDAKSGSLITSGENGIVTIWTNSLQDKNDTKESKLKMKTKDLNKLHKKKPY